LNSYNSNKRAFSLLELIFVVVLITIIVSIATNKLSSALSHAELTKIKSQILLIQASIKKDFSKQTLLGKSEYIERLDESETNTPNQKLFIGYQGRELLQDGLISTSLQEKKSSYWIKQSDNEYGVYIGDSFLIFEYDQYSGKFTCNLEKVLCKEIMK
jgi:general secretion pathway protein G